MATTTDEVTAGEALTAETLAAMYRTASATCACCGEPATCLGAYEGAETEEYGCDECCGHGNEDGHCEDVGDVHTLRANTLALIREVRRLTAALDEAQHSSSMACIDADPDCDCAGCLYARHHNVDGGGR